MGLTQDFIKQAGEKPLKIVYPEGADVRIITTAAKVKEMGIAEPIILGNSHHAMLLSRRLFERGISAQPIVHPAVEECASRVRFFIASGHSEEQIRHTVEVLAEELQKIDPGYLSHRTKTSQPTAEPSHDRPSHSR